MVREATVLQVAQRARVSAMTVSRVCNGSPRVAPATRRRVEKAIAELDYVPNRLPRAMLGSRLRLVALLVADITRPWFGGAMGQVEAAASDAGFSLIVGNHEDLPARERHYIQQFSELRIDGLLWTACGDGSRDNLTLLQRRSIPTVLLDRPIPGGGDLDLVSVESETAGRVLTEHLRAHGRRRLAMIAGPRTMAPQRQRTTGFRKAGGVPEFARHVPPTREAGFDAASQLLGRVDGIVAGNGYIALGVVDACREAGLRIPEDVAVVTVDDIEATAVRPFLTCYRQPITELAASAFDLLRTRLEGETPPRRRFRIPGTLVTRASCGCEP